MNFSLQTRPLLAITKADMLSLMKNPSTIVFNLGFPLIFIFILGVASNSSSYFKIIVNKNCQQTAIYKALQNNPSFILVNDDANNETLLQQGRIIAKINILENAAQATTIQITTASSAMDKFPLFEAYFKNYIYESQPAKAEKQVAFIFKKAVIEGRRFKRIDFLLPGMLGFSLLSAGLFSVAYSFFALRQNMVFKRMFCTPIYKSTVLLGLLCSRLTFQFFNSIILILVGYLVFDFTLVHGMLTFFNMIILSSFGMVCFMSWGFFVSGVAKNDAIIPALTNILSLPQWLLGGVFFSNEGFPAWLKNIANVLPLTRLNEGLRKIAFDGLGFGSILPDLMVILIWTVIGLILSKRFFKWSS